MSFVLITVNLATERPVKKVEHTKEKRVNVCACDCECAKNLKKKVQNRAKLNFTYESV